MEGKAVFLAKEMYREEGGKYVSGVERDSSQEEE